MTHQRLETLRHIARCGAVTATTLASALGITYNAALNRLERLRESDLVISRDDQIKQRNNNFTPPELNWSLTKKGLDKLRYYESHLREVV